MVNYRFEVIALKQDARTLKFMRGLGNFPGIEFMPEASWGRCTRWLTCLTIDPGAFGAIANKSPCPPNSKWKCPIWKPLHLQPVFAGYESVGREVAE